VARNQAILNAATVAELQQPIPDLAVHYPIYLGDKGIIAFFHK
jgi:hypothetical protein